MNKKEFAEYATQREKRTPCLKNCFLAFLSGGLVCVIGRALYDLYMYAGVSAKNASTLVSVTLIVLAGLFTGIGLFDKAARVCGAGLLVPITGFSNAVTAPAVDAKTEGFIMGVGAEMFKIAGPVIVYGNLTASVYGLIYFIVKVFIK